MKHLFHVLADARKGIKNSLRGRSVLIFLDYDGTLTDIAATPKEAVLPAQTRAILDALSCDPACKVVIVSGRALTDIRKMIGLKKVTYVGNHGFEVYGPDSCFQNSCFPRTREIFGKFFKEFDRKFRDIPGVIVEDKGATLSVHYRQVEEKKQSLLERSFHGIVDPFVEQKEIKVCRGKKVLEIRPPVEWDKGKVVLWMLKGYRRALGDQAVAAIYIGDDETDEDAFAALNTAAITVRVGHSANSRAQYYLQDTRQVAEFLKTVLALKREGNKLVKTNGKS